MGHRQPRSTPGQALRARGSLDASAGGSSEQLTPSKEKSEKGKVAEKPPEPEKPKYPFRCEDRSNIPDDIVEGPFEEFEIATDVYSTAYLIARNSGDMYSIWPWKNRQVLIVWVYLLFIAGSQLFVILSVTFWYPPSVGSESLLVVCSNGTAVANAFGQGFLSDASEATCMQDGKFSFEADVRGITMQHHLLEKSTR